jgi:hypothetical protein
MSKLEAYRRADYGLIAARCREKIFIDEPSALIDWWLNHHNHTTAAFITPYNPHGEILDAVKNGLLFLQFMTDVQKVSNHWIRGDGRGDDWTPEQSLLVLGITAESAESLAVKYQQDAYLWYNLGGHLRIIETG